MEYNKSSVEKIEEFKKEKQERLLKEEAVLKKCLEKISESKEGKIFLKYLNQLCLWNEQDLNINLEYLTYKKGRRDIWILLRQLVPKEILFDIEINDKIKIIEE